MNFKPANVTSVLAFIAIVAFVVVAFLWSVRYAYRSDPARGRVFRSTLLGTAVWLGGLAALVQSGGMLRLPLAGLPLFVGSVLAVIVTIGFSPLGRRLALALPIAALVGFQAFRLPLELVLHSWAEQGTIPFAMTWRGKNWDIISGLVALAAVGFADRHRGVAWCANVIGSLLLLNVMRVAIMSSPLPFGWAVTPPLLLGLNLPYAFIVPVCVGGALLGHIVLTRALLLRREGKGAVPVLPTGVTGGH